MENDSVKVFLRLRPNKINEISSPSVQLRKYIDLEKSTERMIVIDDSPYAFDHIFHSQSTQEGVFKVMVEPNINKLIEGFNCSLLAYGQSGSGKTYSMGLNENSSIGMIGMSIDLLLHELEKRDDQHIDYDVSLSYIEIYNEKVFDLLSENCHESIYTKGSQFFGSTKIPLLNSEDAKQILQRGNKNRHVRATSLNTASSRSHAIFSIFLNINDHVSNERISAMNFCDLAGSEGMRHTNHSGMALQESGNINQGLLSVRKVVQALSTGKKLIPYRDSVLTSTLKDSLNDHCYITILGCISPARKDKNETMSTIRFAQGVKTLNSKNVPEFNAFLNESKYLKARTPLKPYMLPLSRNETLKTPGRMFPPSHGKNTGTIKKRPLANSTFSSAKRDAIKSTVARRTEMPVASETSYMHQTMESVENRTFSVLNFSTSTEMDGPAMSRTQQTKAADLQVTMPSFSPFMKKIEDAIDKKLSSFMETFKNQTVDFLDLRNGIRTTVNETVVEYVENLNMINSTFDMDQDHQPISSTVQRPPLYLASSIQSNNIDTNTDNQNETVIKRRTNRRLTSQELECDHQFAAPMPVESTQVVAENQQQEGRIRRSVRVSTYRETSFQTFAEPRPVKKAPKIMNKVVSLYFNPTSKSVTKTDHKKSILNILNTGNFKEVKMLPTIGEKTAYQIVSHRSVNGKFKKLEDVKKLPAMKGKRWEKFAESNMLN